MNATHTVDILLTSEGKIRIVFWITESNDKGGVRRIHDIYELDKGKRLTPKYVRRIEQWIGAEAK